MGVSGKFWGEGPPPAHGESHGPASRGSEPALVLKGSWDLVSKVVSRL